MGQSWPERDSYKKKGNSTPRWLFRKGVGMEGKSVNSKSL